MGRLPKPLTEKEMLSLWQSTAHSINEAAYNFLNKDLTKTKENDYRMYAGLRRGLRQLCAFSSRMDVDEEEGAFETWATKSLSTQPLNLRS
jgi:hypothetical protein